MRSAIPFDLLIFVVATFAGALVAGLTGFAFGLIASAIWLHAITPIQSAALIAAFALVIQGIAVWKLRHAIRLTRLLPFVIGGALGIPLGAEVLRWATAPQMRTAVGTILIAFPIYSLIRPKTNVRGGRVGDGLVHRQWHPQRQYGIGWHPDDHLVNNPWLVEG